MKKLDKRQKDFCKYKALGLSNEAAAIKAGYTKATANTKAHLWLEKREIAAEIERLSKKAEEVLQKTFSYTVEDSFRELEEIKNLALCPDENGRVNLNAATKAVELKGRLLGLYIEKNVNHNTSEKEKTFKDWLEGLK